MGNHHIIRQAFNRNVHEKRQVLLDTARTRVKRLKGATEKGIKWRGRILPVQSKPPPITALLIIEHWQALPKASPQDPSQDPSQDPLEDLSWFLASRLAASSG
jgi:hypothetical protein